MSVWFNNKLASVGCSSYSEYTNSPHWREFRERYRNSDRPQNCLVCGSNKVHLHHCTYYTLGRESFDDVIPLCERHHRAVHDWTTKNRQYVQKSRYAVELIREKEGRKGPKSKLPVARKDRPRKPRKLWWCCGCLTYQESRRLAPKCKCCKRKGLFRCWIGDEEGVTWNPSVPPPPAPEGGSCP